VHDKEERETTRCDASVNDASVRCSSSALASSHLATIFLLVARLLEKMAFVSRNAVPRVSEL
jgi:hypothetical protein